MSGCHIEETDLPGYWFCTEHRVEMDRREDTCPLWEAAADADRWAQIASQHFDQLTGLRHRNRVLTESLAAHADEIRVLRNTIADLAARLLGAP